jgi:hypothetical protein
MKIAQLFIVTILSTSFYANAQNVSVPSRYSNDSLVNKAKKLKQLYLLATSLSGDASKIYKQQFFDEFPNTFKQLNELYGDDSDIHHKPALLIGQAQPHILNLFNEINTVNDTLYYKKLVSISIGGQWDADGVNFFQHGLISKVLNNPELTVDILKNMADNRIQSFWYFYFDSPHPEKQIPEQLQKIKSIDTKIYNLMVKAQNEVLKYWK